MTGPAPDGPAPDGHAPDGSGHVPAPPAGLQQLRPFRVPLRMRFRRVEEREGVLLLGPAGWGEFSPFPEYGPEYAARWLAAAVEAATTPWPTPVRELVPVNVTVPATDPTTAHRIVATSGCSTAKVKVAEAGQDLAADVERVAAVRDALGPDGAVRIDANGAWDVATASLALSRLARLGLEYVEQPCATLPELRDLRRRSDVPVAVDESIRTAEDPARVAAAGAADVLVLKVQPLGGVRRALEVAHELRLPVVVSSALETSVGLAAGLAFAAALPALPHACGLGTATLLAADVVADPLVPVEGRLRVRRPEPDPALLDAAAPSPERAAAVLERMGAAAAATGRFV